MSTIQNLRKSLVRNWRPVCSLVGGAIWGRVCPFPLPPPPASGRDGPVRSRLALPWNCSVPLFCERSVVCMGRLIFSLLLCYLKFKLLSQVSSLRLPSGHSVSVLTLSNATCSSPFRPHLLVADAGVWGYFSAGSRF